MAKLEANKRPLAIAGAAGVAGLALLQRRKAGGDVGVAQAEPAAATSGGSLATPAGQAVYSSVNSDIYNALQPQLSTLNTSVAGLLAQKSATEKAATIPVPKAPTVPVASKLFNPKVTGNYVRSRDGKIAEIQSDGSLFHLNPVQWKAIQDSSKGKAVAQNIGSFGGAPVYDTPGNLGRASTALKAKT